MFFLTHAISGFFYIILSILLYYLPLYFYDILKFSGWQIAVLLGMVFVGSVVGGFPNILLQLSIRYSFLSSIGIIIALLYTFTIIDTWVGLIFCALLLGFAREVIVANIENAISQSDLAIQNIGINKLQKSIFEAIGLFFAGVVLMYYYDFEILFFSLIVIALFIFIFYWVFPNTPILLNHSYNFRSEFIYSIVLVFIITTQWGINYSSVALFARNNLLLTYQDIGVYISVEYLFMGIFAILAFVMSQYYKQILLSSVFLSGVMIFLSSYFTTFELSFIFRCIYGASQGMLFISFAVMLYRLYEDYNAYDMSWFFNIVSLIGTGIGVVLGSLIGSIYGYNIALMSSGMVLVLFATPVSKIIK